MSIVAIGLPQGYSAEHRRLPEADHVALSTKADEAAHPITSDGIVRSPAT
jgi:hypothetical protein